MQVTKLWKHIVIRVIVILAIQAGGIVAESYADGNVKIKELDIAGTVIESLRKGDLTEAQLVEYFETNSAILQTNIDQAKIKSGKDSIADIVHDSFDKYEQNKDMIIANFERFSAARDNMAEKFGKAYISDLPEVVLVPAIGMFANGGWAADIDGVHYICAALERIPPQLDMGSLLAHEIAHGISDVAWSTVLNQFFNEGYASYVSKTLCPGYPDSFYFFMNQKTYESSIAWIDANREKILADSEKTIEVMNEYHKLYFTTSYNKEHPNIGYVIGCEYMKHLNKKYTLDELRSFSNNVSENEKEFKEFILNGTIELAQK